MQSRNKKAFTLIELIVVVVIVGILVVVTSVVYMKAQSGARDSQRRSAVERLSGALSIYHADKKTWALPTDCSVQNTSETTCGNGFVNQYTLTKLSIAQYLINQKYLQSSVKDPSCSYTNPGDNSVCANYSDLMYYGEYNSTSECLKTGTIYARLENPTTEDTSNAALGCNFSANPNMNYAKILH